MAYADPSRDGPVRNACDRKRRQFRRDLGLCVDCGVDSLRFARCRSCREKRNGRRMLARREAA